MKKKKERIRSNKGRITQRKNKKNDKDKTNDINHIKGSRSKIKNEKERRRVLLGQKKIETNKPLN